ncbi:MAG: hypothetical protein JXR94_12125 [Candidatus Hydrogenedentes bacterium]|nr:hypothetical protein [Candidatus Hydrogenedentota bacterium]
MNARGHRDGWILLETLVALMVLSIGIIAVNRAVHESLVTRAQARDYTHARFLLDHLVAELELEPVLEDGASESGTFGDEFPRFSWEWAVTRVDVPVPPLPGGLPLAARDDFELPVPYLGKISATIRWTRAGVAFERHLETLIAPDKLYIEPEDPFEPEAQ